MVAEPYHRRTVVAAVAVAPRALEGTIAARSVAIGAPHVGLAWFGEANRWGLARRALCAQLPLAWLRPTATLARYVVTRCAFARRLFARRMIAAGPFASLAPIAPQRGLLAGFTR